MQEHVRFDYSPIAERPKWQLPKGARVAVWVIPNIEHFLFDRPSTSITPMTTSLVPDILNYSWRDYGARVGVWRMMDTMEKYGIRGTAALNADVCERYPQIIEAGNRLGWEWMGHGKNNSQLLTDMEPEQERELIRDVVETITEGTGKKPRGWLSPALTETHNTPDLLVENGIEYVGNWVNDEQPYPMKVKKGSLYSIPYSIEVNDIPVFLDGRKMGGEFQQIICDTFDVLYEDGKTSGRVMAIALHPFLVGHPHRAKYLDQALKHISARQDVWFATGSEIIDWYKKTSAQTAT
ncbi:MAG: polysaccharide deacetylase [Spongiibacter sp.]|uniref:polysaccharide deacetylase family protein n=1 Tax=Spongiibacter sp. TaxID=2024860 RepID=UPI000C09B717|nr:polysaccharide deacetylase family protein [Spongiibacter sp.]MAK43298.1 polysaccharide deacetylase [Spongiibacter sp.]|tara:strand:- start:971 stop:1852 length:882 start_codon:yes stop_codon:yes gene_type:complete